jgi:hypothetical protein
MERARLVEGNDDDDDDPYDKNHRFCGQNYETKT